MKHLFVLLMSLGMIGMLMQANPAVGFVSGTYTSIDNQPVDLQDLVGEFLLVEIFATWCPACQEMHGELENLYDTFQNSTFPLGMYSFSGSSEDTLEDLRTFNTSYPTPWTLGLVDKSLFAEYNVRFFPTTLLFDDEGNFGRCFVGKTTSSVLTSEITSFHANSAQYRETHGQVCDNGDDGPSIILIGLGLSGMIALYYILNAVIPKKSKE